MSGVHRRRGQDRTLFGPTKNKQLGETVRIDTEASARDSVAQLDKDFRDAKTRQHRLEIARATQEAANRAKVISENPRNSEEERRESAEVSRIYDEAAKKMFREYDDEYRS